MQRDWWPERGSDERRCRYRVAGTSASPNMRVLHPDETLGNRESDYYGSIGDDPFNLVHISNDFGVLRSTFLPRWWKMGQRAHENFVWCSM